jgi:hypothetical protein
MSASSFADLAADGHPGLGNLLLAAAAEFGPVDRHAARVKLDRMAARLYDWVEEQGHDETDAVAQLIAEYRLRPAQRVSPPDALLDQVLERGEGHPALIAAACVEAGVRAGLPLAPVGKDTQVLIGVHPGASGQAAAIVDPAGTVNGTSGFSWRCEHEVTFVALSELSRLLCLTGDVPGAMRATELRGMLPISDRLREHLAFEAGALQAMFN